MSDQSVRFLILHFTGDERVVHEAVRRAIAEANDAEIALAAKQSREPAPVTLIDSHASGRDPRPATPEASAKHARTLRDAGHHEPADHLEQLAAVHARTLVEHHRASAALIQSMPGDVCVPGRPLDEHARVHHQEAVAARKHAADAVESVWAINRIEALLKHRPETTKKEIGALIATARKNAAERHGRIESTRQRDAAITAEHMKAAHERLAEFDDWKVSGLSLDEWTAKRTAVSS